MLHTSTFLKEGSLGFDLFFNFSLSLILKLKKSPFLVAIYHSLALSFCLSIFIISLFLSISVSTATFGFLIDIFLAPKQCLTKTIK